MLHTRPRPTAPPVDPPARFRRTRRAYRSRAFAGFSALLLALIAAAGVWVAVGGDDPADGPATAAPAPSSTAPQPTSTGEGGCPALPFEDQSLPDVAPAATWTAPGPFAAAAPASQTAGPVADAAGVERCYARTPVGALFAAAGFLAAASDPAGSYAAVQDRTVPNAGQDVLLQLAAADVPVIGSGGGYAIAAFRPLSAGLDTVAVAVVLRVDGTGLVAVPVTLTWRAGTWQVRLPDDGNLAATATPLSSLDGFEPWRAG